MCRQNRILLITLFSAASATTALADMTGNVYQNTLNLSYTDGFGGPDFDGVVVDIWLEFDDANDVLLNVYNFNDPNIGTNYYQSYTGQTWLPNNLGAPLEDPCPAACRFLCFHRCLQRWRTEQRQWHRP